MWSARITLYSSLAVPLLALLASCSNEEEEAGGAADELGLQSQQGRSEVILLEEEQKSETVVSKRDSALLIIYEPDGEFTVQIGLYENARMAAKIVSDLSSSGYPAYAIANPRSKGVRVRIGYFATREEADRFGKLLKEDRGVEYWIDRRSREQF